MRVITVAMDIKASCPGCGSELGLDPDDGQCHSVQASPMQYTSIRVTCPLCSRLLCLSITTGPVLECERVATPGG